jgi:asparagine synthase (glutamine-hydrolysing)
MPLNAELIARKRTDKVRRLDLDIGKAYVLPLEEAETGLPLVHGLLIERENRGEYSALLDSNGSVVCKRDVAGTRPIYLAKNGKWLASDHRFFPGEEMTLLPPGTTFNVTEWKRKTIHRRRLQQFDGTFEEAGRTLAGLIADSVRERVEGRGAVAVSFSGGLDSAILVRCAKKFARVIAVTVGVEGSRDDENASRAASELGVEISQVRVDRKVVGSEMDHINLPFQPNPMDRSLWCIYSIASRAASERGAVVILLGQLADELFGGYMKYRRALSENGEKAAASLMETDVNLCGMRGFLRDELACSKWTEPRFPYAERRVIEFGLGLPVPFKIRGDKRKAVLREAARELGVPDTLCEAPKKAAQYSTGVMKLMEQLI